MAMTKTNAEFLDEIRELRMLNDTYKRTIHEWQNTIHPVIDSWSERCAKAEKQITLLEAELATLKARESAEGAWERGQMHMRKHQYGSRRVIALYPYIAPTAEEDSK